MNGYMAGAVTGGIGKGIDKATTNILNLYGMQQRFNLQQQDLDIQKQNSDTDQKRMQYHIASRFEQEMGDDLSKWMTPASTGSRVSLGGVGPRARRMGLDASLDVDPRYMQPGADALPD